MGAAVRPRGAPPAPPSAFPQFSPYAWLLPPALWHREKRQYIYSVEFVTPNQLTASGTRTRTVGVDRDSYFAAVDVYAVVTNTDNTTFIDTPAIMVQMTDAGRSIGLQDKAVHFLNLFNRGSSGDGRGWNIELPRLFDPGSTISVTLENLEATARHVRLSFRGFRVYE